MDIFTTHCARITGPVAYLTITGQTHHIPIGPCLIENNNGQSMDIIWGFDGQSCAVLTIDDIMSAKTLGYLVLL